MNKFKKTRKATISYKLPYFGETIEPAYFCRMKRILVWIFILQFATGHNLLAEFVRMPSLLEHYQSHRQETPNLSFAVFLWQHYLDTSSHTHSDNSHQRLPLHCSHGHMAESVMPHAPEVRKIARPVCFQISGMPLSDDSLLPNDYSSSLFRPPIA